jgi:F-type H+-transporting ATPase subunit b
MNPLDTLAQVQHTASSGGLFDIDPGLSIWTWVVFGALFFILSKYAWKPMMESVKMREKVLSEAVENARRTKEELENIAKRQEQLLNETREQTRAMIEQGRKSADENAKAIVAHASKEASQVLERAREQIETEKQKALIEIRQQAVDLVIQTSEKLIVESLDDEKHRRIVNRHLEEM